MLLVTLVVAGLVMAAVRETTVAYDQARGQQALALAEAGAYRALAELRHRVAVDLDAQLRRLGATGEQVRRICRADSATPPDPTVGTVDIVGAYAWPVGPPLDLAATDWVRTSATAYLRVGRPDGPVAVTAADGTPLGEFHAVVAVRPSGAPAACVWEAAGAESYTMWFDSAVLATARVGNARRTVCLLSPQTAPCAAWDWRLTGSSAGWTGSYLRSSGAYRGWPVVVQPAPHGAGYSAPRSADRSDVFSGSDPLLDRPRWMEVLGS